MSTASEIPDVTRLERIFADYMFDEVVPFWVRQFTRTTLEAHDDWRARDPAAESQRPDWLHCGPVFASGAPC